MRKIITTFVLSTFYIPLSLAEISDSEFAGCAVVKGDLARLECFDSLAVEKNLDGRQTIPTDIDGKGKWNVGVDTNPIDDSRTVNLVLRADSGASRFGEAVFLVARCQSNSTDLYINWNEYLGSEANVLTRVGSSKAVTKSWSMSTDSQATFHRRPIGFLKKMLGVNSLVAQITPYSKSPVTAIFDTTGLTNAITPLRETCGW